MRKTSSELSANSKYSAKSHLSLRKRMKETLAMALSLLMVFGVVGMPIKTDAKDYSYNGHDNLSDGQFFFEGDTLSFTKNESYYLCRTYFDKQRENYIKIPFTGGTYVTGDYYQNAVYTFPGAEEDVPNEIKDSRLKMVYEYLSAFETDFGRELLFMSCYGIQVQYLDSERSVVRIDYTYYDITGDNYLGEHPSSAGSLEDDDDLGEFIGWSTNPDYVDETSGGLFVEPEDEVTFDKALSYVSDGILTLYPIYRKFVSSMVVEMTGYRADNAASVTNPTPTGYAGSNRTFSWKYFETDKDGTVLDDTKYTTAPPSVAGYYKVVVTAAAVEAQYNGDGDLISKAIPEETASADFKVTGIQDSIVFNPENKTAYFKAFGHTMLVEDLVTGIKGGATLHFQLDMGGFVFGIAKDQYVDKQVSSTKIKIYTDATDLYEEYESSWYSLPIEYCEWPDEECTVDGEKVEGVTMDGMDVYDGAVKVVAPEGYYIINDYDVCDYDGYDSPDGVLVRESDGAETGWHNYFEKGFWVDIDSPEVRPGTLVLNGNESEEEFGETATFAAKEVEFDVDDHHYDVYDYSDDPEFFGEDPIQIVSYPSLVSVTVDGVAVELTENALAHVKLTNNTPKSKTFTVVATDIAKHETTWKITLSPELETAPDPAYTLDGTQGKNNYFTSEDITIKPADGYTISVTPEDPDSFTDGIEYDEEIEEVWLYHTETGKYTEAVPFEEEVLIDTKAPEIVDVMDEEENEVSLSDGAELGVRSLYFTVEDDQILNSVTLNGTAVSLVDGVAIVQLYAAKEDTVYELIAEDKAGLTKKITFTIKASDVAASGKAVAVEGLIYDGSSQELVTAQDVENGTIMYSFTKDGDYTETVPTKKAAGTYTVWYKIVGDEEQLNGDSHAAYADTEPASVKVTIAQKEISIGWSNTIFTYDKASHCLTAVAQDLVEGDTCTLTVEGAQVNAGTHEAKVTGLSNSNYKLPANVTTTFTIRPITAELLWYVAEFYYDGEEHCITADVSNLLEGDTCKVTVTGGGVNRGRYTATATALSNPNYVLPDDVTQDFNINPKDVFFDKKPIAKTLTYNGQNQELLVPGTATTGGKIVYQLQGTQGFSDTVPVAKNVGEYHISYTVDATDDNHSGGAVADEVVVTIAKKALTLSWGDKEFTYDGKEHLPSVTLNGVVEGEKVVATVTGAKTAVGTYTATVTITGDDISNYSLPDSLTTEFTIKEAPKKEKETGSASVTMGSFTFGGSATTPVVTSTTHDISKASISYKASGAPDSAYTGTKPTGVGTYTVRAVLPENEKYKECVATGSFTISYLPIPEGSYEITGKRGVGGWYTSEVQLTPAAGYEISVGDRSSFKSAAVTLTEQMAGNTFYIRKTDTGEQTAGVTIAAMQIDVDAPTIEMEENNVYFCDEEGQLLGMANDKNLDKVYVDGVEVEVKDDGNGNKIFELPVDRMKKSVTVKVVDQAGNEKSMVVITAPAWMKSGVVGEGEFYLELQEQYGTPSGGPCSLEGDASTYMPGMKFFAKRKGFHTFHLH